MKSIRLLGATLLASTTLLGAASAFAEVSQPAEGNPNTAQTPITAELTVNATPDKPTPPTAPDEGGTDKPTDITGLFGIAYAPKGLTGTAQLKDSGETQIDLASNDGTNAQNKHNVGVQDKTRAKDRAWTLKAQLVWDGDNNNYMAGSTITATEGNVKLNTNGVLSEVTNDEVTMEAGADNVSIGQDSEVTLMKANAGQTVNGVYNYQFKAPKLVIPNSENVAAGTYSGNIVWNLSNALGA
ncbi:WxL domain-containing protein [Enterococcus faecalis]|uniref:WxL domain-containing protein n=1 Tax=Enterococcus faecalis TaxID=1351 RepID=UPI0025AED212|nr:WxL domain-containing protein [Enterococcus faecalis]MDN3128768.1 WxL domain-containing protein [Enterococcus faecalis]